MIVLSGNICGRNPGQNIPEGGVLDLSGTTFDRNAYFNLNGEWEFYWEKLLSPDKFGNQCGSGIIVTVPSYWNSYVSVNPGSSGSGYGTYALKIILPPETRTSLCFDIPVFDVAYRFYLNDRLVSENGAVGTSREEEDPWYEPARFCYVPDSDTLQLLIQVSNFHHRRGGYWKSMYMGGTESVLKKSERLKMYNYSTIGILFFFTLFFFIFWWFSRHNTEMLLFAVTALGMLMLTVNTGLYFSNSFVHTPWSWQIRMEYFGTYLAHAAGMIFLHRMFPRRYMNRVITANTVITSLLALSVFTLPVRWFAYGMLVFQPLLVLFLLHYLVISLIGTMRRKMIDGIFFISLGIFMYTVVMDILLANTAGSVSNNYLSQISFQVFIFAMSVIIIMQWVSNFNTRLELESSLRFKNRVLSVIAHDLKNPVASIAQFSDLLVTKPELENKQQIMRSLQESSQSAVGLLDNLLYWSRSQSDELMVVPVDFRVDHLVEEAESLFIHMATHKGVVLRTEVFEGTMACADRNLVNIVIRNLVSNAIKFTPGDGKVTIRAQPEGKMVRLSVTDTGVGIKPEILERFRESGQMKSSVGTNLEMGTGLGLQLVSDLVVRNGGVLKVESILKKGSTFTFTVPGSNPTTS